MSKRRGFWLFLGGLLAVFTVFGQFCPAGASSANVSYSYSSNSSIQNGSLVSLDPKDSGAVVPANTSNGSQLIGVAVNKADSRVAVAANQGSVQVATTGIASVLVSNLDGDINVGDQVGVSPFNGIGIKALLGSRVIGIAHSAFNSYTAGATTEQVNDKSGKTSSVKVGYVQISIAVSTYTTGSNDSNLNGFQKFAKSLTGHTISTVRIILSLVIAVVAIVMLITMLYGAIYSSIVSVGRNPLAKYAIFRTLRSVLLLALFTALVAGLTIFLLLS